MEQQNKLTEEEKAYQALRTQDMQAVSYTHLTLPTKLEV